MKVKTINYQKVFPLAQYVNERIGVEIELSVYDNEDEAFAKAKELVHSWADERAQIHDMTPPEWVKDYHPVTTKSFNGSSQFANQEPKQEEETEIGVTPEAILSCKELKILQTYRFIKDTKPELKRAYEMKMDELSNQKS